MSNTLFSERLRELRRQCHLTQQAVADRLQIHRTAYTKYETGVVTPDHQGLVCLAEMFGVSVDYLLGRDDGATPFTDNHGEQMRLTLQEQQLLQMFRQLGYTEQQALVQQMTKFYRQRKNK